MRPFGSMLSALSLVAAAAVPASATPATATHRAAAPSTTPRRRRRSRPSKGTQRGTPDTQRERMRVAVLKRERRAERNVENAKREQAGSNYARLLLGCA